MIKIETFRKKQPLKGNAVEKTRKRIKIKSEKKERKEYQRMTTQTQNDYGKNTQTLFNYLNSSPDDLNHSGS